MKLRKNRPQKLTCEYCFEFFSSVYLPKKKLRLCHRSGKLVSADTEECSKFVFGKYFYCDKNVCFLTPKQCIARKKKARRRDNPCFSCKQYKMIRIYIWRKANDEGGKQSDDK